MSDEDYREQNVPTPSLDDGDDGLADDDGGGGLSAKKIVLFVILPLFILIGIGGGLYFTGKLDSLLGKADEETQGEDVAGNTNTQSKPARAGRGSSTAAYFLAMPDIMVNLRDEDGHPRYLRLGVKLELASEADMQAVEAVMPRVIDQFQTYLRELRVRDLRGSQGTYRLQMELLSRVNAAAYPIEVKDVLFQEILIQ